MIDDASTPIETRPGRELLSVDAVSVRPVGTRRPILTNVTFSLRQGDAVALVGPNATGKSTLLRGLIGAAPLVSGQVWLAGDPLPRLASRERARRIALVPQFPRVPATWTVRQAVELARTPYLGAWGRLNAHDHQCVDQALASTGLVPLQDRLVGGLSGGEQQRVLLARTMAQSAPVWLLDEPTAHLDLAQQRRVIEAALDHAAAGGAALVVLHDLWLASLLPRVLVVGEGTLVAEGAPAEVLDPPLLRRIWGVDGQWVSTPAGPVLALGRLREGDSRGPDPEKVASERRDP